jgi:hypothetical protein
VAGENSEETFVQVYAPAVKEVLDKPTDPFLSYKKVGKVWMTDKSKSPKAAAMAANNTGLYLPGAGTSSALWLRTRSAPRPKRSTCPSP